MSQRKGKYPPWHPQAMATEFSEDFPGAIRGLWKKRKVRSNPRSSTGQVPIYREGISVQFESGLERDLIERFDFDSGCTRIRTQGFYLEYEYEGKVHRYTPDVELLCDLNRVEGFEFSHSSVLIEVKYQSDLQKSWSDFAPRFHAATTWCRWNARQFMVLTELDIRTPLLQTAKALRRYLAWPADPWFESLVRRHLSHLKKPTLGGLIDSIQERYDHIARADVVDIVYAMLAQEIIGFEREEVLKLDTKVWLMASDVADKEPPAVDFE